MNSQAQKSPFLSIIIPVKNGSHTLDHCLRSVKRSSYRNFEVIVVNDHSTDNTVQIARSYNCTILEAVDGEGANYARNIGASNAKGEILLFLDSDIVVRRDTILEIVETLEEEKVDAVVGIYSAKHRHETFVSQYKNLWVRYSYLKSSPAIDWLFGSISGIKRKAFERIGGFNVELLARHGHDDIELGKRFAQSKLNIVLNIDAEVEHLKNYTIRSFIRNEFDRSSGFANLALRLGELKHSITKGFVNVYTAFIYSTFLSVIILTMLICTIIFICSPWYLAAAVGLYFLINIRFLNYLEQVRGLFAMIVMIPILFLDHLVCFVGSCVGIIKGILK